MLRINNNAPFKISMSVFNCLPVILKTSTINSNTNSFKYKKGIKPIIAPMAPETSPVMIAFWKVGVLTISSSFNYHLFSTTDEVLE